MGAVTAEVKAGEKKAPGTTDEPVKIVLISTVVELSFFKLVGTISATRLRQFFQLAIMSELPTQANAARPFGRCP